MLEVLIGKAGEIVTREELCARLWPENTFVDFDTGLNTAIKRLREALGDSADNPFYIETVPRKGYRFIAAVEAIEENSSSLAAASPEPQSAVPPRKSSTRRNVYLATALVAFLLLAIGMKLLWQGRRPSSSPIRSIAVLPLENLSGPTQDYFVDGMTDALTTDLGKIGHLRVVSRTSSMRYKGTKESLQEIAKELDVDGFVEGSVERDGDRVRITTSLVQATPEKHVWANTFESNVENVLDIQDGASRAIANAIQVELSPEEKVRLTNAHTVNRQAYDAYLQGRFFADRSLGGPGSGEKPAEYFELAVRDDPGWSLPYSELAAIKFMDGVNLAIPNESCTGAKAEALEALKRDPDSAEAHTVLADIYFFCEWNWADAEKEVERAIDLNPNFAQAHSSRGRYLLAMGKSGEMLKETSQAVELDPLAFRIRWDRWLSLYTVGRYDEALAQCRKIEELKPELSLGYLYCGDVYVQKKKFAEAVREEEKALNIEAGKNPRTVAHLGYAYALSGRRSEAQKLLERLINLSKSRHVHPDLIALIYVGLGQKNAAFEWLGKAYEVHGRDLLELNYDPQFASLRTDPRFTELTRRIGLPLPGN